MPVSSSPLKKSFSFSLMAISTAALSVALCSAAIPKAQAVELKASVTSTQETVQTKTGSKAIAPDNSAVNRRDRKVNEVTADQQSSGTPDMEITRSIRRALVSEKNLSLYAHNIKIITIGGVVTLKGPVRSKEEKISAEKIAQATQGVTGVDNRLSVKR